MRNKRLPFLFLGLFILAFFLLTAFFPMLFTSFGRKEIFSPWLAPSLTHLLGTNSLGYDIYTELIYGARETILIGISSSLLSAILGMVLGILSARSNLLGRIIDFIVNSFLLLPRLIALIVLASFLGGSTLNLIILISIFTSMGFAKTVKGKTLKLEHESYVEASRLLGYSRTHIVLHHYLPNLRDTLSYKFLLGVTTCIMMESSLSFLGFGDLYYPSWGTMISFARSRGALMRGAYVYLLAPCVCIALLSLGFYFLSLYGEARQESILEE